MSSEIDALIILIKILEVTCVVPWLHLLQPGRGRVSISQTLYASCNGEYEEGAHCLD